MHDLTALGDELATYAPQMILHPKQWAAFRAPGPLHWELRRFTKANASRIPNSYGGVYGFVVRPGIANNPYVSYLLYIGKTTQADGFRGRFRNYLQHATEEKTRRPHIRRMLDKWPDHLWFMFARIDGTDKTVTAIEDALLKAYIPPYCHEIPGKIGQARAAWK